MMYYIMPESIYAEHGIYEFRKSINVKNGGMAKINIFAATRYILYINGNYICEGPCRGSENLRYYDTIDTDVFVQGENTILVKVLHMTENEKFTSVFKTSKPMLLFEAIFEEERFESDLSWECSLLEGHMLHFAKECAFVPPFEDVTAQNRKKSVPLIKEWSCSFERGVSAGYGLFFPFKLEKRSIPMIYPGEETSFSVVKVGEDFLELDAGSYMTAKPEFHFAKNSNVKIIYAECYETENGKGKRDDSTGFLKGNYDTVQTGDEDYIFEPFWFRAFRFIRIETKNPQETLISIKARRYHYPLEITGKFTCSDENYNKMVDISINTLLCCMHEIFVDCPYYEQQQYVMDSAIECSVLARMSKDIRMMKKCISEFAASQHPNGLLSANYPCSYTQIIPGFSFFWIFLLKDYLEYSADVKLVRSYTGTMDCILNFFEQQVQENGYITTSEFWDYVDWVPGWERGIPGVNQDEAITVYNLYYAKALKDAAFICRKTGREMLAKEYDIRYVEIKNQINELCFDKESGLYKDGSVTKTYSVHTIIWSILSEVVSEDKIDSMVSKMFDDEISKSSFSMNYYLFRALEKCGHYEKAIRVFDDWKKMIENHCTTWCENPDSPRSECHAWSCAPYHEFSSQILGVKYSMENEILIKPFDAGLSYARGVVPTRYGHVEIQIERNKDEFKIHIIAPKNVDKRVILPNGCEYHLEGEEAEYSCNILS